MTFLHRLALLAVCSTLLVAGPAAAKPGTAEKGKEIYDKRCTWCHGAEGDGAGASKDLLNPPPRDFTSGNYKIKSSAFEDMVPSDDDVFRKVRKDFDAKGVDQSDHQIRRTMSELLEQAIAQIRAGG